MDMSILSVFGAGLLTFFSPCVLPMVPIIAANYLLAGNDTRFARVRSTVLFSLGFLMTFTLMGLSLPFVTDFLGEAKGPLLLLSGVFIFLYGVRMSGLAFQNIEKSRLLSWMGRTAQLPDFQKYFPKSLHGFLFGATFGLAWTPCVGPILGGVLAYVATQDRNVWESAGLMLSFAMGIVIPFVALAVGGDLVQGKLNKLKKYLPKIEEATGYGLMVVGVLVLSQSHLPMVFSEDQPLAQVSLMTGQGEKTTLDQVAPKANKLLFFHTSTCPICHAMEAYLPTLEKECQSQGFQIVRVNVELPENQAIAARFNVRAVPTISLLSANGEELARSVGYQSETKLRQAINLLPKMSCNQSAFPQSRPPEPNIEEGKSCSDKSDGLTC